MIRTKNRDFGFHGTVAERLGHAEAEQLFDYAAEFLMAQGLTASDARKALDAVFGRHYADQVLAFDWAYLGMDAVLTKAALRTFPTMVRFTSMARTAARAS